MAFVEFDQGVHENDDNTFFTFMTIFDPANISGGPGPHKGTSREVNKLKSEVTSQEEQVDFSIFVIDSLCVVVMPASSAQKYHICRKYLKITRLPYVLFSSHGYSES